MRTEKKDLYKSFMAEADISHCHKSSMSCNQLNHSANMPCEGQSSLREEASKVWCRSQVRLSQTMSAWGCEQTGAVMSNYLHYFQLIPGRAIAKWAECKPCIREVVSSIPA
ncbi:hypothetical protein Bbelb_220670 [Branchiostoma belcheri]|nr:hypothetical protein Bbelb_220670 [Branchiostoma belcheri]